MPSRVRCTEKTKTSTTAGMLARSNQLQRLRSRVALCASRHFANLALASRLADELNKMRTSVATTVPGLAANVPGASSQHSTSFAVPPSVFCAPAGQDVVTGVRPPEARGDLAELGRQLEQQIAVVFGVPSALVSDGGKFAQSTSAQLYAFNAMVTNLATHLSRLLTDCYRFSVDASEGVELVVASQVLRDVAEVSSLYSSGMVSREAVVGMAMRSLGADEDAVAAEEARAAARDEADAQAAKAPTAATEASAEASLASAEAAVATADDASSSDA
jgi:hypothetical protein